MAKNVKLIEEGYKYGCINCNTTFKEIPTQPYEDGHGGSERICCLHCGEDLIIDFETNALVKEEGT